MPEPRVDPESATKQSLLAVATGILAVSCVIGPEGAYDAETEEAGSLDGAITIDTSAVYTIVGVQSGECVQVAGGSTADAAAMQIASCIGSTRQQLRMESAGAVTIASATSTAHTKYKKCPSRD